MGTDLHTSGSRKRPRVSQDLNLNLDLPVYPRTVCDHPLKSHVSLRLSGHGGGEGRRTRAYKTLSILRIPLEIDVQNGFRIRVTLISLTRPVDRPSSFYLVSRLTGDLGQQSSGLPSLFLETVGSTTGDYRRSNTIPSRVSLWYPTRSRRVGTHEKS